MLIIVIIIGIITFILCRKYYKSKEKSYAVKNEIDSLLNNYSSNLFQKVERELKNINSEEFIDNISIDWLNFYDLFRDNIKAKVSVSIMKYIEDHGIDWLNLDTKIFNSNSISNEETNKYIEESLKNILDSDAIDSEIAKMYISIIEHNLEMAKDAENAAIKDNEKYGKEDNSDPELHPIEQYNLQSGEDEIAEISLDKLASTGTVEDIDE